FNSATETDRDGRTVDSPNVKAINIDLGAHGGTIGTADNDLDIDSGLSDAGHVVGRLYAEATSSIYITESNYELRVLAAKSETGDVRLTVPDTSLTPTITRGTTFSADPSFITSAPAEDLFLLDGGSNQVRQAPARQDVVPSA